MRKRLRADDGLGLTEVMIAMLILLVVMVAILSVLITALQTVGSNSTQASADQLVQARLEEVRTVAVTGDCQVVKDAATPVRTERDGRGVPITVSGTVANCDQTPGLERDEPKLARVTVTATTTQTGFDNPLVVTVTDIYVKYSG